MGLFITFEGPDGAGKSTQLKLMAAYLKQFGYDVLCTREPGGTNIGDQIRRVVLDADNREMSTQAEILLYSASRAQLVEEVILPHLAGDGVVLCDRYADSFYAYQGYGRQMDFETLRFITRFATQNLKPDLTIYLDLAVEQGLQRRKVANKGGQGEWNRLDQLEVAFHQRVRAGYQAMIEAEPERWLVVDGSTSIEVTHQAICHRLADVLSQQRRT